MASNENWGPGGGGFLQILGIIYLIKRARRRRAQRREAEADRSDASLEAEPTGHRCDAPG